VAPVPGVPYDANRQRIPHQEGQVLGLDGAAVPGLFVAGWAKRGPSGVIGTNKPDAAETVRTVLAAHTAGSLPVPAAPDIEALLEERGVQVVHYDQWKLLDALEIQAGEAEGRPRVKFADVRSMLEALAAEQTAG
jgi:ferredoxin--NADP+ reductase